MSAPARPAILGFFLRLLKMTLTVALWCLAAFWAFVIIVIMQKDPEDGAKVLAFTGILVSAVGRIRAVCRQRKELAHQAAAAGPLPPAQAFRPSRIACQHPSRGPGQLAVDAHGNLHFVADASGHRSHVAYYGLDLEQTSISQFLSRRLEAIFVPAFSRKLYAAQRDLTIPRGALRCALPFARRGIGPTALVAHQAPGESEVRFDEFMLYQVLAEDGTCMPTADAEGWVRNLGLPEPPAALRTDLERRRRLVRRRMAWADIGMVSTICGVALLGMAGLLGGILAMTLPLAGMIVAGIITAVYLLTVGLCTAANLYYSR
jgi:hypothetical protein